MIYHLVYKIVNKLNNKFYVGVHSTNNLNDNYMGSGLGIKRAIKKYGVANFKKEILFIFDNKNDALKLEKIIVDTVFVNQNDTYNANLGGIGGSVKGRKLSDQMREKTRARMLKDNWQKGRDGTNKDKFGAKHYLSKPVAMIDINTGLIVNLFESTREAQRITGNASSNISACCLKKKNKSGRIVHKTVGGYYWRYYHPWRGYFLDDIEMVES